MSANPTILSNSTEAPYSINTTYADKRGFNCQITLRGDDGADTMKRFDGLLDWLLEHGAQPADRYGNPTGARTEAAQRDVGTPASNGNGHADHTGDASWCAAHGVSMKLFQKDGRSWYSHKDGDHWCKGAVAVKS